MVYAKVAKLSVEFITQLLTGTKKLSTGAKSRVIPSYQQVVDNNRVLAGRSVPGTCVYPRYPQPCGPIVDDPVSICA